MTLVTKYTPIPYSSPVIKVTPLTSGSRALCTSGSTKSYLTDEYYDYGELD